MLFHITECDNRFVSIEYNSTEFTFSCRFLNEFDTSQKSCSVQYGNCDEGLSMMTPVNSSFSRSISLKLNQTSLSGDASYCYIVTATNESYTARIEGILKSNVSLDTKNL